MKKKIVSKTVLSILEFVVIFITVLIIEYLKTMINANRWILSIGSSLILIILYNALHLFFTDKKQSDKK